MDEKLAYYGVMLAVFVGGGTTGSLLFKAYVDKALENNTALNTVVEKICKDILQNKSQDIFEQKLKKSDALQTILERHFEGKIQSEPVKLQISNMIEKSNAISMVGERVDKVDANLGLQFEKFQLQYQHLLDRHLEALNIIHKLDKDIVELRTQLNSFDELSSNVTKLIKALEGKL